MLANELAFILALFFLSAIFLLIVFIKQKAKKRHGGKIGKLLLINAVLFLLLAVASCATPPPAELPVEVESEPVLEYAIYEPVVYEPVAYEQTYPEYAYNGDNGSNGDASYEHLEYELAEDDEPQDDADIEETSLIEDEESVDTPAEQRSDNLVEARVSRVIDGDTLELTNGERVRLIGVNAPEIGEAGADEATRFVRNLVEGQTVWLESSGNDRDRFNRLRRYVWVQEPTDTQNENEIQEKQLNAMLLTSGLAVVFNVSGDQVATQPETERATAPTDPRYIGNRNSDIFHHSSCNTLPAAHNRVYFDTRNEAVNAGFRACRNCRP